MHLTFVGIGKQSTNLKLPLLSRQIVARGLPDVLREFSDNENDFISVMETVARMSEDGGRCIFLFIYLAVMFSVDNSAFIDCDFFAFSFYFSFYISFPKHN